MSKPVIAVFGATGAQGGGLARAILADPQRRFALRAITRNPEGPPAAALKSAGAEIFMADFDDVRSVVRALEGAHGAYLVTNFWEHLSAERELTHAYTAACAAAQVGLRHVVWSTLEDTREFLPADGTRMPTLQGKYNVPHFDAKGEADRLFAQHRVPTTFLRTSFYWDNLIHLGLGPKTDGDETLAITLPMGTAKLPGIAAEDIGKAAFGIFARGPELIGRTIGVAGEHLSGAEMAQALTRALGEPVRYQAMAPDEYRALGFPGADELGNMFQFKRDFESEFTAARSVAMSREYNPALQTFNGWLSNHANQIPLA